MYMAILGSGAANAALEARSVGGALSAESGTANADVAIETTAQEQKTIESIAWCVMRLRGDWGPAFVPLSVR
jgi:hypothetical protein